MTFVLVLTNRFMSLFVEDQPAMIGLRDLRHLPCLVVAVGVRSDPVAERLRVVGLDVPGAERLPVVPAVVVLVEAQAALDEAEDPHRLPPPGLLAREAMQPRRGDPPEDLHIEGHGDGLGAGLCPPGIRLALGVVPGPFREGSVRTVLMPDASLLPLLEKDPLGQLHICLGAIAILRREGWLILQDQFGEADHRLDHNGVADGVFPQLIALLQRGSKPSLLPVRPIAQEADGPVEVLHGRIEPGRVPGRQGKHPGSRASGSRRARSIRCRCTCRACAARRCCRPLGSTAPVWC